MASGMCGSDDNSDIAARSLQSASAYLPLASQSVGILCFVASQQRPYTIVGSPDDLLTHRHEWKDQAHMDTASIIAQIDAELEVLSRVRNILGGRDVFSEPATKPLRKKRKLSAEARERIAAAQRKRWAAQKKAAKKATSPKAKKLAGKETSKKASAKGAVPKSETSKTEASTAT